MKTEWSGGADPIIPSSALDKGERLATRPGRLPVNTVLLKAAFLPT
jgi:hypothetical protein